jgi:hypothetical protein
MIRHAYVGEVKIRLINLAGIVFMCQVKIKSNNYETIRQSN